MIKNRETTDIVLLQRCKIQVNDDLSDLNKKKRAY